MSQRSKSGSEGKKTIVVPPVVTDVSQLHIKHENLNQPKEPPIMPQADRLDNLNATLTAQIVTGEPQPITSNQTTQQMRQDVAVMEH